MEETKEQQDFYILLRAVIYLTIALEFFEFAMDPEMLGLGKLLNDVHTRIGWLYIYHYDNLHYSKLFTLLMIAITCIGTRAKKQLEFNARNMVLYPIIIGSVMLVLSVWLYYTEMMHEYIWVFQMNIWLYMLASVIGAVLVNVALDNVSKHIKDGIMKDRFNFEMEAFEQNEEYKSTKYSVNIPMRYYYKGKFRHGWININNPFRGTFVIGTPGSGKSFSVIEPFIRQQSSKGFSMVVYDYKFPTLAQKLYYHYRINKAKGLTPERCKFNMINFVNVEYSRRVNPLQHKYIPDLAAAQETAETLVQSLQKGKDSGGGGSDNFFQTSAVNFLAACIFFFVNYKRLPYDKDGKELTPEYLEDPETHHRKLTGRVFKDKTMQEIAEPAYWLGKYSDMPHVLSFLNLDYKVIFEILATDTEVYPLLGPFMTAYKNKAMEQLEGMIGTLRVQTSRLATKEAYWIFHRDGDDFDLKVSDPKNPSYLLIASDPEKESIIGALNAMILNRLVTRVNTKGNVPVSIIVDELPTLYFHKIDNLIATARSNKVCVLLGFQELPQLEANYGKVNMEKITATIGNVISGSARNKATLEWLSSDIMGRTVQVKKNVSVDDSKTSVTFNEGLETMLPSSKIADMATGWLCGQVARDFSPTATKSSYLKKMVIGIINSVFAMFHIKKRIKYNEDMNIQESEEFQTSKFFCKTDFNMKEIEDEEADYKNYPLPKFYTFHSVHEREQALYKNFDQVNKDVDDMVEAIQKEFSL